MTMSKKDIASLATKDPGVIQKELKRLESIIEDQKQGIENLNIRILEQSRAAKSKTKKTNVIKVSKED